MELNIVTRLGDDLDVKSDEYGDICISILDYYCDQTAVTINKEQATQLRDFLNQYLEL